MTKITITIIIIIITIIIRGRGRGRGRVKRTRRTMTMKTKKNPVNMMMMKKMMIVRRRRRRRWQNRYHERVPWHCGEKTLKDLCGTQLVNNPVIAVTVDYRLIEVERGAESSTREYRRCTLVYRAGVARKCSDKSRGHSDGSREGATDDDPTTIPTGPYMVDEGHRECTERPRRSAKPTTRPTEFVYF